MLCIKTTVKEIGVIIINILLTKRDADIIAFKKYLPNGEWSKTVANILSASMRDRICDMQMNFVIVPVESSLPTKLYLSDKQVAKFCEKFGCGKGNVTTRIKNEIKRCIRKNLHIVKISSTDAKALFAKVNELVDENEKRYNGALEKDKFVHEEFLNSLDLLTKQLADICKGGNQDEEM